MGRTTLMGRHMRTTVLSLNVQYHTVLLVPLPALAGAMKLTLSFLAVGCGATIIAAAVMGAKHSPPVVGGEVRESATLREKAETQRADREKARADREKSRADHEASRSVQLERRLRCELLRITPKWVAGAGKRARSLYFDLCAEQGVQPCLPRAQDA